MTRSWIDINCDCGESFGKWRLGHDEEMFKLVTTANLACGFHGGDPLTMLRTVRMAKASGVMVGAHPGLPDLMGFGRRAMAVSPEELYSYWLYQIGALQAVLKACDMPLNHVKPHGAMAPMLHADKALAESAAQAMADAIPGVALYWLWRDDYLGTAAQRLGIPLVIDFVPDLAIRPDGTYVIEREKQAKDPAWPARQVRRFITEGVIEANDGSPVAIDAQSMCLHGDGPNAVEIAQAIRKVLDELNCQVRAVRRPVLTAALAG